MRPQPSTIPSWNTDHATRLATSITTRLAKGAAAAISAAGLALGVALLVFLALRLVPGDPTDAILGENAESASRARLRTELGLDQPLPRAAVKFLAGVARGDLGRSIFRREQVRELVAARLPFTALLAWAATLLGLALGIPLGLWSAFRPGGAGSMAILAGSAFVVALPSFWLGPLLVIVFSLHWPWLPISGYNGWESILLPAATLGLGMAAWVTQTTRAAAAETIREDYIRTARAKGASWARVLFVHALPNALPAILTVCALQFGHLLAGAIVIETVFDWPGIGKLAYDALLERDYPVVQGCVLVTALIYVALGMVVDAATSRRQGTVS